jgi:sucrose-6-phosphate hydrolase SacC (GH32 family)
MKRGEKRLPAHAEGLYEINLTAKGSHNSKLDITLKNAHGDQVVLTYDFSLHTFAMDRTKSGIVDFSSDFPCTTVAPTSHSLTQNLRLFIDRSSIEAFDGEGRWVMTNLVFPNAPYNIISVNKRGDASVQKLTVYNIKK